MSETVPVSTPAKKRVARNTYPADFEAAWRDYPTDGNMSKVKAFAAWTRLDPADRKRVAEAIPGFNAYCRKHVTYRPVHMVRFISERRFDNYSGAARAMLATVDDWQDRLSYARRNGVWSIKEWGPSPGSENCLVPKELLTPSDGRGWTDFQRAG